MRAEKRPRPRWALPILAIVLGSAAGVATVALATAATRQTVPEPHAVFDATHLPPLLTLPGERVDLAYEAHCAAGDTDTSELGCEVRGTVFVRAAGSDAYQELTLEQRLADGRRQLAVTVPEALVSRRGGFEYYAELEAPALGERIVVPGGGADAPHASRQLESPIDVPLGRHAFGRERLVGARVAFAPWGDGAGQVGLEQGRNLGPVGASAFDVDTTGTVVVLDQANRRLLRWRRGVPAPTRVPLSVSGNLADLALADDGTILVLETTAQPGGHPLVKRFDDGGRELEAIETAERTPSQVEMTPNGPVVLSHPSHQWTPVAVDGSPSSPREQLRHGRSSRPLRGGGEIVVLRRANEIRIALIAGSTTRSWRLTSDTSLAEVQLAERMGQQLVLVARVYDEHDDEFVVLTLGRSGIVRRATLDSADWAETAPLSRFRLVGRSLYRLGSTSAGAFVDRFDLEVR